MFILLIEKLEYITYVEFLGLRLYRKIRLNLKNSSIL